MTKLEELNAAYAASTQGEWSTYAPCSGQDGFPDNYNVGCDTETRSTYVASVPGAAHYAWSQNNAKFIALAHNLMPTLLEVVELLKDAREAYMAFACDESLDLEDFVASMQGILAGDVCSDILEREGMVCFQNTNG